MYRFRRILVLGALLALPGWACGCSRRIQVTSEPPGAEILLDAQPTGLKTPAELLVQRRFRSQTLGIRLPGYHAGSAIPAVEERGYCPCWMSLFCCTFCAGGGDGTPPPRGSARHRLASAVEHAAFFVSGSRMPSRIHVLLSQDLEPVAPPPSEPAPGPPPGGP